ncbi:MAG TPA: hypothetical protein VFX16_02025 [Pseudonocardiaceae bacterium]|nr:hypothetical protein [Pseudonocardiaceae bacterium]
MGSGKRITVALVGLVLLAVVGWLATDLTGHGARDGHGGTSGPVSTAPVSPSAPRPAGASG